MKNENSIKHVDAVISETKVQLENVLNKSQLGPAIVELILENALCQVRMLKMINMDIESQIAMGKIKGEEADGEH